MTKEKKLQLCKAVGADMRPRPDWGQAGMVPYCSTDDCPNYDGKRCRLLGFRPGNICEPVVEAMAHEIQP